MSQYRTSGPQTKAPKTPPPAYGKGTLDHHRLMNAAIATAVRKRHPGGLSITMASP
ncbi:hypothetical protein AB0D67_17345 [Streptosporangium sp. NPDC048047]|uniref:hypothetical protein n=1 Tax=Streptosporangium sp. NPDC048047 TaxID=3155748 RepID=UPI00342945C9